MNNRRQFLVGVVAVGSSTAAVKAAVWANERSARQDGIRVEVAKATSKNEKLDLQLVHKFVGRCHGDLKTVKEMLVHEPALLNAAWDWRGGDFETGLNAASHVGRREIAEFLLEKGARLDVAAAVMLGVKSVVAEMLRSFPRIHAVRGAHEIPLLSHAIMGRENSNDIFELLIEIGADVNAHSRMSMTPLMAAASIGHNAHVKTLLERGADRSAVDFKGRTALDVARKRKHDSTVRLLK